jgi:hypothetical protein
MADLNYDLIKPDEELRLLQEQLRLTPWSQDIKDRIDSRQIEIMKERDYSNVGFGSFGYVIPNQKDAVGKAVLEPTNDPGVYSASLITSDTSSDPYGRKDLTLNKTNDPTAIGTDRYDANATNLRTYYDAKGNRISPTELAKTQTGKAFAAAGWDIGFGPGMIGPGVKADTSERDAYIASKNANNTIQEGSSVEPTPLMPSLLQASVTPTPPPPPAKTAPIDTVLFNDDLVPIEIMTDLIFENIGGQELINITRNDIINGQQISYSPIKNLVSIQQQYNPNNIISLQSVSTKYFANFPIKLDEKIPNIGNGPNGSNVYIDPQTGDLIIETVNNANDEQIDIQVGISGTIYEADI